MDTMGDGDELEDEGPWRGTVSESPWTPEARAFTAVGLVLASLLSQGLFQFFTFFISGGNQLGTRGQALLYAGPAAVLSGIGAVVGWRARLLPMLPTLRGASVASTVVGALIALAAAAGIVAAWVRGAPDGF
jgi:hypothetical protein